MCYPGSTILLKESVENNFTLYITCVKIWREKCILIDCHLSTLQYRDVCESGKD